MLPGNAITRVGRLLLIALGIAMAGTANVAKASVPVKQVPICIDDFCFPLRVTGDYYVKVADFNSDTKPDLYVTGHPTSRYVSDFILYQNTPTSYTIAPTPTPAQKALATTAPISSITVSRVELNADAYYDFYLRNVEEAIPDAVDIIVTLTRGTGGTPAHVVPVTEQFQKLAAVYTSILSSADEWVSASQQTICGAQSTVSVSMPGDIWGDILFPQRTYDYDPPWMPYFPDFGWGSTPTFSSGAGGIAALFGVPPPPVCMPAYNILNSEYKDLISTLTASQPGDIWSPQWCHDVFQRYGLTCENRFLFQNVVTSQIILKTAQIIVVVHEADETSNDGVQDLVLAIKSAASEGYVGNLPPPSPFGVYNKADVGPGTNAEPATGVDKYANQWNCDMGPDNAPSNRGPTVAGSSESLSKNMKGRGCGCPAGSDAHHILPKADGQSFPPDLRTRIRNCLNNAGLDVDHPENGVCLPKRPDPNSKAVVHGSANQKTYWTDVAQRCEDAYNADGTQGVRQFLQQARKNLVEGKQWWKPFGGPFD